MKPNDSFSRQTMESDEWSLFGGAHIGRLRYLAYAPRANHGAKLADLAGASSTARVRFIFHDCVAEQLLSDLMGICLGLLVVLVVGSGDRI